jgi:hypothetical protein
MDKIMLVSSRDTPSAKQISKPGVTIGTKIAKDVEGSEKQ